MEFAGEMNIKQTVISWLKWLPKKTYGFFTHPEIFFRYGIKVLVRLIYRVKFTGFDNIPATGPAILISNHVSYMDGLVIIAACKRPVSFVIDEGIYNVPMIKYFMDLNGGIPIAPRKDSVQSAIEKVTEALKQGKLVCIFPEGSLTYTGNLARFRFGVEWMVQHSNAPVIPMALKGLWGSVYSRKYLEKKYPWLPKSLFRKVTAICGKPIPPEKATINHMQRVVMELKNSVSHKGR